MQWGTLGYGQEYTDAIDQCTSTVSAWTGSILEGVDKDIFYGFNTVPTKLRHEC